MTARAVVRPSCRPSPTPEGGVAGGGRATLGEGVEASLRGGAARWACRLRCRRAIGQLGKRTHAKSLGLVGVTGGLQVDAFVETPSVAMD